MKSKCAIWTVCFHVGFLLLASTKFSVVSWIWGRWAWTWDYFKYSYQNGWGYQFESDYSFLVVLTYLAAFATGILGYIMAGKRIASALSVPSVILCVLGMISFLIESSHWLWAHHLSWIAICPIASLVLAGAAIIQPGMTPNPR